MTLEVRNRNILYLGLAFSIVTAIILNQLIGFLFIGMFIAYFLAAQNGDVLPITRGQSSYAKFFLLFTVGIGAFFVFGSFVSGHPFNFFSVIQLYGTNALTQISVNNSLLKFIIWGMYIPLAETLFFLGFVGSIASKIIKPSHGKIDQNSVFVAAIVGAVAVVSHIVSQGVADVSLALDFVFFGASMLIALYERQLETALGLHVFLNSAKLLLGGLS